MCDKLVDVGADLSLVPMLATGWHWSDDAKTLTLELRDHVTFQDGTPFDAAAVKFSLERELTLPGSRRKSEIDAIEAVEATGPLAVTIHLSKPAVPLLAAFADRPGMIVSPKAATEAGANFAQHPVCVGPYRFAERVVQDHITLERDPNYWRAGDYTFDRLTYVPISDTAVRLTNLRSGQLDLIEQVQPTDMSQVKADKSLQGFETMGLGYSGITFNIANGARADNPAGKSAAVRRAISLAIDREAIVQVAFDGRFPAGNQPFPPASPYYDTALPVPKRDLAGAKAALASAHVGPVTLELLIPTDPVRAQIGQMIQAMLAEAGITVNLVQSEFVSLLDRTRRGDFQADLIAWSGRVDPDLNIAPLLGCGAAGNDGHFCNADLDAALAAARATPDPAQRKPAYAKATAVLEDELPIVYLYHAQWLYAAKAKLQGFRPRPDGIIRLDGVTLAP
ncbi:ABC transporter substrate-binding protein [Aliidongia dinghuensis]|uniref:ABC transporter substrate-binding protein n=2 Tax=Aliidongia dinghuensis TaxID=1867774 RepID=A0A8J2YQU6_9PROT|nr:ABC transporter substrate-binding protein [Aliidongia dinghuensis]